MMSEKQAQKFYTDEASLPRSDWSCRAGNLLQPIRTITQILFIKRHVISMEFLRSFHFAGEQVVEW